MFISELITAIENSDEEAFGKLADNIQEVRAEFDILESRISGYQSNIKTLSTELETARNSQITPAVYVKDLEKRLQELQTRLKEKEAVSITLPIITSDIKFTDTNVIILREMKTAVYMNKLIEFIENIYKVHLKAHQRKCFLLVLDPLQDEHRVIKYRKHQYPINVSGNTPMLISNYDYADISKIVNLSSYDEVTIIDRYQRTQPAVQLPKSDTYFLVDSFSDPVDYNLPRDKCLAFLSENSTFRYRIEPNINLGEYQPTDRPGLIAANSLIERLYCNEI